MVGLSDPFSFGEDQIENSIETANNQKSPRIIKTHLSVEMLPDQLMQKKNKAWLELIVKWSCLEFIFDVSDCLCDQKSTWCVCVILQSLEDLWRISWNFGRFHGCFPQRNMRILHSILSQCSGLLEPKARIQHFVYNLWRNEERSGRSDSQNCQFSRKIGSWRKDGRACWSFIIWQDEEQSCCQQIWMGWSKRNIQC